MTITLHLVRHAQGFHNLNAVNEAIPDPYLTPKGLAQCAALRASFPRHDRLTHLVASPMRRTLLTCYHSFEPAVNQGGGGGGGKMITALPLVQEISANPCDTGSEPVVLRAEFGSLREDGAAAWLDDRELCRGWNDKTGPGSPWAPRPEKLEERARGARRWLRELGRGGRGGRGGGADAEIAVVTHGGFLHFLTQDWDGMDVARGTLDARECEREGEGRRRDERILVPDVDLVCANNGFLLLGTGWDNTEWRSYEFVNPDGDDEEASIRETEESWRRRRGGAKPLGETEQQQARAAVIEAMRAAWLETGGEEAK